MATMATTSHGLSVYVNSCVKNPVKTKHRANGTFANGQEMHQRYLATDPGPNFRSSNEFFEDEENGFGRSLPARASFEDVETQLKDLTDEQFYLKLQQLKQANRKTLEDCEILFKQKYGEDDKELGTLQAKDMVESMFAARLAERSGHVDRGSTSEVYGGASSDPLRSLSSKPPPAPGLGRRDPSLSKTAPYRSALPPSYSRPRSAPTRDQLPPRRAYSLDEDDWRKAMQASSDISDDEVQSEGPVDPELLAAVSRIRDMWQGFKIETGERRHSSVSLSKTKKKKEEEDIGENWRHRITIPKPFHMSQREELKVKKKTKAQMELEEKRLEKQRQEEEECQKKFKAQPVPAHIYLPLYDEIKEKNEARRRYVKTYCKDMLKSQEKPFNFTKREEEKKQQRAQSATVAERIARSAERARKKKDQQFTARPVPDFIYDKEVREKQLEEEEYRKIRVKLRARELLKESSLPPNMAALQKLKEQKEKEKLMTAHRKIHKRQKRSHRVPDYDFLYSEFQKELARRKQVREATVTEPFDLSNNNLRSNKEQIWRDMERDEKVMRNTARGTPRTNLGYLSSSLDSIPCKSTASADLRTNYFRSMKDRDQRKEELRQEEERRRRMRENKLRKYITDRSDRTPRHCDQELKERLRRHKEADSSRLEQYEKDLEEIKTKVDKRPLLFEQQKEFNARKLAEKKYKSALKNAGLDEDFIATRARSAPSATSHDDYDDDGDATYTKHMEEDLA